MRAVGRVCGCDDSVQHQRTRAGGGRRPSVERGAHALGDRGGVRPAPHVQARERLAARDARARLGLERDADAVIDRLIGARPPGAHGDRREPDRQRVDARHEAVARRVDDDLLAAPAASRARIAHDARVAALRRDHPLRGARGAAPLAIAAARLRARLRAVGRRPPPSSEHLGAERERALDEVGRAAARASTSIASRVSMALPTVRAERRAPCR